MVVAFIILICVMIILVLIIVFGGYLLIKKNVEQGLQIKVLQSEKNSLKNLVNDLSNNEQEQHKKENLLNESTDDTLCSHANTFFDNLSKPDTDENTNTDTGKTGH